MGKPLKTKEDALALFDELLGYKVDLFALDIDPNLFSKHAKLISQTRVKNWSYDEDGKIKFELTVR